MVNAGSDEILLTFVCELFLLDNHVACNLKIVVRFWCSCMS